MSKPVKGRLFIAIGVLAFAMAAGAGEPPESVRTALAAKVPGAKPEDVHASPVPGLFEVSLGAYIVYVSADGRFLFDGDLYDIEARENVTESRRVATRAKALKGLDESQMIVFSPENAKHTVTVFTDIDCGYCRKLHADIAKINELGIRVRYLAFPRSGPGTPSWNKAAAVWCSKNRQEAITRAKAGENVAKPANCKSGPIEAQYALGEEIGVRGTPAILAESGEYLGGYLAPQQLAQYLDRLDAERVASKGSSE